MISEMYSEKVVGYERTDGIGLEKSLIQKRQQKRSAMRGARGELENKNK